MSLIIAGRFQTFPIAEAAAQRLFARGFLEEDVTLFYVAPSGQHGLLATGGDHFADAGAQEASKGAGKGVAIGAVLGAIVGAAVFVLFKAPWLAAVLAAGAGAYVGSLAGAMSHARSGKRAAANSTSTDNHGSANAVDARQSGVVVAVHVAPELQAEAAAILRDAGGKEVERASGQWLKKSNVHRGNGETAAGPISIQSSRRNRFANLRNRVLKPGDLGRRRHDVQVVSYAIE